MPLGLNFIIINITWKYRVYDATFDFWPHMNNWPRLIVTLSFYLTFLPPLIFKRSLSDPLTLELIRAFKPEWRRKSDISAVLPSVHVVLAAMLFLLEVSTTIDTSSYRDIAFCPNVWCSLMTLTFGDDWWTIFLVIECNTNYYTQTDWNEQHKKSHICIQIHVWELQ